MSQRIWMLLVAVAMFTACKNQDDSTLAASQAAPDSAFVALVGGEIYVSSEKAVTLAGVCASAVTVACKTTESSYVALQLLAPRDGRNFYKLKGVKPAGSLVYSVIDSHSNAQLKFRFEKPAPVAPVDPIAAGLAKIQVETMRKELTHLASDDFNGRLAGTKDNEKAADFLIANLKELNIQPLPGNDYRQSFTLPVGPARGKSTANIIGYLPGTDPVLKDRYIVIGAHMDHAGTLSYGYTCGRGNSNTTSNKNICNGADDNGSGTIAVLNVAKALSAARQSLKRSVIIMWFTGEEEGLLGSKHYVRNPLVPIDKTDYMINMDMVGYMSSYGNQVGALGSGTSKVAEEYLKKMSSKYLPRKIRLTERAGGGSDHVPFMQKNIPGVFFHTGVSNNKNYHRTSDTADKIDFEGMTMAAKVAFELVVSMGNNDSGSSPELAAESTVPFITEEEAKQDCHDLHDNQHAYNVLQDHHNEDVFGLAHKH